MGIPVSFRRSSDTINSSYDWFDYAAGAGYKRFYPVGADISGSSVYWLTSKAMDGDNSELYVSISSGSNEKNFDVTFNAPVEIAAADAYISWFCDTAANASAYFSFTIYHVNSGGTETSLGTVTTSTLGNGASTGAFKRAAKLALTNKAFGVGEKLRLEVIIYQAGTGAAEYYFDPNGRKTATETTTGVSVNSIFSVDIPFKIDI